MTERGRLQKRTTGRVSSYTLTDAERLVQDGRNSTNNNGEVTVSPTATTEQAPAEAASPAQGLPLVPAAEAAAAPPRVLLDQEVLFDCLALCKRAGGVDKLTPYLDSIRRLLG